MNELEQQLSKILEQAIKVAEQTGEFVIEQAPLLLQEFYRWHLTVNVFNIICSFLIIFIAHKVLKYALSYKENPKPDKPEHYVTREDRFWMSSYKDGLSEQFTVYTVISSLSWFSLIWAVVSIYKIVFIIVAPKLYLIEYFVK